MAIIINLPRRSEQTSPLTAYQWDVETCEVIEQAFAQVTNNSGSVSSVSASVPTGLSVNVTNPTSTPAIAITNNMAAGIVKSSGVGSSLTSSSTINFSTETTGTVPINRGGTNSTTALSNNRILISSGGAIIEGDTATYPSTTEISYVKGVTSSIQTQLNAKQNTITVLATANGGTGVASSDRQDLINYLTDATAAATGDVLTFDGTNAVFSAPSAAGVTTVNTVSGAVTLTVSNTNAAFGWTGTNLNIATASGSIQGLLSSTDWTTFNAKLTSTLADGSVFIGNASNVATARAVTGDVTISNTGVTTLSATGVSAGTYNNVTVDTKGRVTAATNISYSNPEFEQHTSGATFTMASGKGGVVVNPSTTLAALTIFFPLAPINGEERSIVFGGVLTSGDVVTSLTLDGNGKSVFNPLTGAIATNAYATYKYNSTNTTWYLIG